MSIRLGWDKHETTLLIDACIRADRGEQKKLVVQEVSLKLRQRAVSRGIEIDDVFRNENGIDLQMTKMEYLLTDGKKGLPGASKFFAEMVKLMRNAPQEYAAILQEAQAQVGCERRGATIMPNNRTMFAEWLSNQTSLKLPSDRIISVLDESSEYATKHGITKTPIWDIDDAKSFAAVYSKLSSNRLFRILKKNTARALDKAYCYYRDFLNNRATESPADELGVSGGSNDEPISGDTAEQHSAFSETLRTSDSDIVQRFSVWMQHKGMADATVRNYSSSIRSAQQYAVSHQIENVYLLSNDLAEILQSIDTLLSNKEFIRYNQEQHNRFSAAFRKMRDYISELQRKGSQQSNDVAMEMLYPTLYQKLRSISKVYDDPQGITLDHIESIIGNSNEAWTRKDIVTILDGVSWATRITAGIYSFSKKPLPIAVDTSSPKDEDVKPSDFNKDAFVTVLMRRFPNGMEFDSIDLEIFRDTYSDLFDETLNFSDEELEKRLKLCGVMYRDRIFPADGIIDPVTRDRLFAYIENQFTAGNQVLYYTAIFSDLSDAFAYCFSLTDEAMLKAYLEFVSDEGQFFFNESYMAKDANVEIDHAEEIVNFMLNAGKPMSYEDIYAGLSHIDKDIIYREIHGSSKFVMNEKEHYFHIDIFEFSHTDGEQIAAILNKEISEDGYAIWSKAFERIQDQLPVFLENNLYLSSLGIRNALSQFMSDRFNFEGDVISACGVRLSMGDVFRLYAKHHTPFSDKQIQEFSREVGSPIYFWDLAKESVRVSKSLFVAKDQVHFDVDAVDKALGTYLMSGYILLKEVDSFLLFPNVNYEWNAYLLESFLLHYSKKYTLVNNGTSLNNVAGAIARKDGEFTQFVDVCAQALADSNVELKKAIALNYLAEVNLITRRSYKELETAMTKARRIRNRKG